MPLKICLYIDSHDWLNYEIENFNNIVYNCAYGIGLSSAERNVVEKIVYNNVVYDCASYGVDIIDWSTYNDGLLFPINDIRIENNTLTVSNSISIYSLICTNTSIGNNILYSYTLMNYALNPNGVTLLNNLTNVTPLYYLDSEGIVPDSYFVNPALKDFQLSSNSFTIDSGATTGSGFDFNYLNRLVGKVCDIGAYESIIPVNIPVKAKPAFTTTTSTVCESLDDGCEIKSTNVVALNSISIITDFTSPTSKNIAAIHFKNVDISQRATIINARIELRVNSTTNCDNALIQIRVESMSNAQELAAIEGSFSSKERTISYSNWLPGLSVISSDKKVSSLDFIVSERVSKVNLISGNAMTFLFEFTNTADVGKSFVFSSFDGG